MRGLGLAHDLAVMPDGPDERTVYLAAQRHEIPQLLRGPDTHAALRSKLFHVPTEQRLSWEHDERQKSGQRAAWRP